MLFCLNNVFWFCLLCLKECFLFADEADGVSVVGDIGVSERYIVGAEVEVLGIVLLFACGGPICACGVYVAYFGAISIAAGGQKYCSCELHFVPLVCAVFVFGEVFFPESIAYARFEGNALWRDPIVR